MWRVVTGHKVDKRIKSLPSSVRELLFSLVRDIELHGPVRGNWPNYSKLSKNIHHCHLKKGKPTYVAIWTVLINQVRLVEIIYVGTHEKSPY